MTFLPDYAHLILQKEIKLTEVDEEAAKLKTLWPKKFNEAQRSEREVGKI